MYGTSYLNCYFQAIILIIVTSLLTNLLQASCIILKIYYKPILISITLSEIICWP